jgi:hypothetical protein
MYEHDDSGWQALNEPMPMVHFAAVNGGRCYAVGADNSLWEYTPPTLATIQITLRGHTVTITIPVGGWSQLWAANAVWSLDAVTQKSGVDAVFAVGGDGRLEKYEQGNWQFLASGGTFNSFSAGLDEYGRAAVWVVSANGDLERWTAGGAGGHYNPWHVFVANGDPLLTISATTGGQVFGLENGFGVFKVDYQNPTGPRVGHTIDNVTAISAIGVDDVFAMTADGHLYEHIPGGDWVQYA